MSEKLIRWCVVGVAIALLPVAFAWISLLTTGQSATLNEVLENGALLLITAAISGAAIGELVGSGKARIKLKLAALASLRQDIATLRKLRGELEAQVTQLALSLDKNTTELTAERDRSMALEARLSDEQERTALAQREIDDREIRLDELQLALLQSDEELTAEREISVRAANRIAFLNDQIAALRAGQIRSDLAACVEELMAGRAGLGEHGPAHGSIRFLQRLDSQHPQLRPIM